MKVLKNVFHLFPKISGMYTANGTRLVERGFWTFGRVKVETYPLGYVDLDLSNGYVRALIFGVNGEQIGSILHDKNEILDVYVFDSDSNELIHASGKEHDRVVKYFEDLLFRVVEFSPLDTLSS
ncbi:hypothetical protein CPT_Minot_107 [Acinetobacter phage Minot]|nr:hypothetical protein CPT_Minot_107 [Acinetobacter phage Minot]QQO96558.1 hypothetical protein CPT_Mokit_107 [Acinetobacter phage Mokit]